MASLSLPSLSLSPNLAFPPRDTPGPSSSSFSFPIPRRQILHSVVSLRDEQSSASQPNTAALKLMSLKNGNSYVESSEGVCKVIWRLEMEETKGALVYLTGEAEALGSWNPDFAIPCSRSPELANLWEAESMVPCGIHFKYNYLVLTQNSTWPVPQYRKGPKLSLSVPACRGNEPVHVRDCWIRNVSHRIVTPSWDSWLFDPSFSQDPCKPVNGSVNRTSSSGKNGVSKSRNEIPLKQKSPSTLSEDIEERHTDENSSPRDQPKRNPSIKSTDVCIQDISHLKYQPVEEPWLLLQNEAFQIEEPDQVKDPLFSSMATVPECSNWENNTVKILISSSACNVRRIAVVENDTLVELILESRNNSVLYKNIYLGIIKEMMPKTGGALVNIGLNEPVFMFMGENREPFLYADNNAITGKKKSERRENVNNWAKVSVGDKIIVQVVKPEEGETSSSSVMLTPYPEVESRFWILRTRGEMIDVSQEVEEPERDRLLDIVKTLKPAGFGLKNDIILGSAEKVSTENLECPLALQIIQAKSAAAGHPTEELEKDLKILLSMWDVIVEHAKSAVQAARVRIPGSVPAMLHQGIGQDLAAIYDYIPDKVESVLVDSQRIYHEVTIDLQRIAPELCGRVKLYKKRTPLFDEYKIEKEMDRILCKSVPLPDGGSLVIEQTEAFVSIDVNSGRSTNKNRTSQEKASLKVNLAAAKQIARELRLRDISGVIIVDFIDMANNANKVLVYEEMKKEVKRDRSKVTVSEISGLGLMEITREKVHHRDTFVISEPCKCCHATGRVEALETSFSKIEREILRFLASSNEKPDPRKPNTWPRFLLKVDSHMCDYMTSKKLTAGKRTSKLEILTQSLKVRIMLKTASGFSWGTFELTPLRGEKDVSATKMASAN